MKDPLLFPDIFEASFILICLFGIQLFIGHVSYYIVGPFKIGDPYIGGIISLISFGLVLSWLMHYKCMNYRDVFHPHRQNPISLLLRISVPLIIVIIGLFIVGFEINKILASIFPMSYYYEELFTRQLESGVHSIITVSFIAPFVEEFLFRGIFLRTFLEQYSTRKSIIVSSLLFAVFHLNIYQFVIAFGFGIFSGWIYSKTYSLFPCLLIHFVYNFICLIYVTLQKTVDVFPFNKAMSQFESLLFLMVGILFVAVGMIILTKKRFHFFS